LVQARGQQGTPTRCASGIAVRSRAGTQTTYCDRFLLTFTGASTDVTMPREISPFCSTGETLRRLVAVCSRRRACRCESRSVGRSRVSALLVLMAMTRFEWIHVLTKFNHCLPGLTPSECRCGAISPATGTKHECRLLVWAGWALAWEQSCEGRDRIRSVRDLLALHQRSPCWAWTGCRRGTRRPFSYANSAAGFYEACAVQALASHLMTGRPKHRKD